MGNHSEFISRFRLDAEKYIAEGRVKEIEFSRSTYQIEVIDDVLETPMWSFLQFDEAGTLIDAFCSCESANTCVHLAAAFLRIYNGDRNPLHIRFKNSFWNALALCLADHLGYNPPPNKISSGGIHFSIVAKNAAAKKRLQKLMKEREKATPENSLKFSNLSAEEIAHWREGRPSHELQYELSFWADLAKWLMLLQDKQEPYSIGFQESKEGLPTTIKIEGKELSISCTLTPHDLLHIIPALDTVASPLKVFKEGIHQIEKIIYDEKKRAFFIQHRNVRETPLVDGKSIDDTWVYIKKEGFYLTHPDTPLLRSVILEEEIGEVLTTHHKEIAKFLEGIVIHTTPVMVQYEMRFDREWNWHFSSYLFKKGDLSLDSSNVFAGWAFIKGKGFYPLSGLIFETKEKIIAAKDVGHFINRHRVWLNTVPGFSIHLASIETYLSYTVSKEKSLKFFSKFATPLGTEGVKDFGEWIYYENQGFFSKHFPSFLTITPPLEIRAKDVSFFIKNRKDELESIPHFFYDINPLKERGLKVYLEGSFIIVEPKFELMEGFDPKEIVFFEEYVYVKDKGFVELPLNMRLPDKYREKVEVEKEEFTTFFGQEFSKLKASIIDLDPSLQIPLKRDLEVTSLEKDPTKGLKGEFYYLTEFGRVPVVEIHDAINRNERYLFSKGGRFDLRDESLSWITRTKPSSDLKQVELSTMDLLRLDLTEGVYVPPNEANDSARVLLEKLRHFSLTEEPNFKGLNSELRLYQKTGLEWLWFLYGNGLSGLLCDDMGLGKTHQTMALLASTLNQKKAEKIKECRFLVVAPTSVIYHWEEKLATFLPHLKVHFFHGLKRSLKRLPKEGLILTSYGILRSEIETLKNISFEIAVFDEMQVAKNPSSRVHDALLKVNAKMRLGLSGTPIENNLRELKSLFDIVLPGLMPQEKKFRDEFILPIEREGNSEKKAQLTKIIKPFILRRKKKEVLTELPEKTEDKITCELSSDQIKLYKETLEKNRTQLLNDLKKGDTPIPYVHIFSLLSTLKQVCDHPALITKDPENYKNYESGKWDLFTELLNEAIEGEQKVVIFSQYLTMLDIMKNYFEEKSWAYAEIRGDTTDRKEQMRRFQEDPNCLIFIGSLNAAGLGIDLTAASIVILYDRWWNAARENQAIDRVHRIGQKWGVQVYKLLTKGTIEEKIDAIITKKGKLLEEIILTDDETISKKFTREELIDLLTFSSENP